MADPFNVESVISHFENAVNQHEDDVHVMSYVQAYEELSRLFNMLGMIFSFVESDVKDKREILKNLHAEDSENYCSVKTMVEHEIGEDRKPVDPKKIGARTLLRLHRALNFLVHFVKDIHVSTPESNMSELMRCSYEKTLSQHHGWFIRKTVSLASHAVPNREYLMRVIFTHGQEPSSDEVDKVATRFVTAVQNVYDRVQVIYEERQLLELP